ncbi:MAG: cell division protein FtsB [Lysobacterales bacterium]|jgi:cell division protein FtsB
MFRLAILVLLALLVYLQVQLWTGAGGRAQVEDLAKSVERQRVENGQLEQRNAALEAEVVDLKEGASAVEERARAELGMIQPGEVFYRVVDGDKVPEPPPPSEPVEAEDAAAAAVRPQQ